MVENIRIFIADDHDIVREGLRRILSNIDDFDIIGETGVLPEVIRKVNVLKPDILLLDLQWFGDEVGGIETIYRLKREGSSTKIVAITVYRHLMEQAKKAGADAAVSKDITKTQLIDEIRAIFYLPSSKLPEDSSSLSEEDASILTKREITILAMLAEGKTDKEIAYQLGIAESTAKSHVSKIISKLQSGNRAGAVALGYQKGLIKSSGTK